jgi:hypothetical protein
MKKIHCLLAVLALAALPLLASAQGFYDTCGTTQRPSLYMGWATNGWMSELNMSTEGAGIGGTSEYKRSFKASAAYGEIAIPFDFGNRCMLTLAASGTLPGSKEPGREEVLGAGAVYSTNWKADTFWGNVSATLACPLYECVGNWYVLANFGWDTWQTSFSDRSAISPGWGVPALTDTAGLTVNLYIPKIGVMNSSNGLTFGALFSPLVFGNFALEETYNNGGQRLLESRNSFKSWGSMYFATFAEYVFSPFGNSSCGESNFELGGFARFIWLDARKTGAKVQRSLGAVEEYSESYDVTWRRELFVVGGKATVKFNMPNMLSVVGL